MLPGRQLDPQSILDLFSSEQVTLATAVPTVWAGILEALEKDPGRWKLAPQFRGFVGGTAVPEALVRKLDQRGLRLIQVWGMTETTPVAVCSTLKSHMRAWTEDEQYRVRVRQGRALPFMEVRVVNDNGEAPWDGTTLGELHVRGPWVASSYFNAPGTEDRWTADGGCAPATSPPSMRKAMCRLLIAPKTSSSPAANGSARLTWKTLWWGIPPCAKRE